MTGWPIRLFSARDSTPWRDDAMVLSRFEALAPPGWTDRKAKGRPTFSHTRPTLRLVMAAFIERTRPAIAAGSSCGTTRAEKAVPHRSVRASAASMAASLSFVFRSSFLGRGGRLALNDVDEIDARALNGVSRRGKLGGLRQLAQRLEVMDDRVVALLPQWRVGAVREPAERIGWGSRDGSDARVSRDGPVELQMSRAADLDRLMSPAGS